MVRLCVNNVSAITHLDDGKSKLTNQKQLSFPQSQRSAAPNSGTSPTTTKAHRPYRDFQRAVHHIIDISPLPWPPGRLSYSMILTPRNQQVELPTSNIRFPTSDFSIALPLSYLA